MACIYQIRNILNNKIYVGSTQKKNNYARKSEHFSKLKNNNHCNKKLQNSWNKYGEESFLYEILEDIVLSDILSKDDKYKFITDKEIYYMNFLKSDYNIVRETRGGKLGNIPSEEQKLKLSILFKNRVVSEETKQKIRIARSKQIITEETKQKISKATIGKSKIRNYINTKEQNLIASINLSNNFKNKTGCHSESAYNKRKKTIKQKWNTPKMRDVLKKAARKRNIKVFYCYLLKDNSFVGEFKNQIEASEILNIKHPTYISAVLTKNQNSCNGYRFTYIKE